MAIRDKGKGTMERRTRSRAREIVMPFGRGQLQSVLGEDRPKSPDLGSFGDPDTPVVLSDLDTWLENAYPLLSTTYGCGGPEEQFCQLGC